MEIFGHSRAYFDLVIIECRTKPDHIVSCSRYSSYLVMLYLTRALYCVPRLTNLNQPQLIESEIFTRACHGRRVLLRQQLAYIMEVRMIKSTVYSSTVFIFRVMWQKCVGKFPFVNLMPEMQAGIHMQLSYDTS